ncbi:hypothetical protein ACFY1L_09825 [Streptomyces sp. NPDC001663]|uniref:hypothetical protein n=1 Tax=Streptomyces sp. NPDC001663 TaxID=3364597 RepID=UPI0036C36998
MGDHFQRIVDVEVSVDEAGPLAARTVEWLVEQGVITRELSDDGVYSPSTLEGYRPGPDWQRAVAVPEAAWPPGPLAVMAGRDYYVEGQGTDEADHATCPRCTSRTVITDYPESFEPDEEVWRPFRDAVDAWKATGEADVTCPACGTAVPITEWDFGSGFLLGALAFDFWGWPPLADGFVAELGRQLGHRTEQHTGKF